jgi:regulator of sirC expression with transglutaminase-like and TPR domain
MNIETVEELCEYLADRVGVYGNERTNFVSDIEDRIRQAVSNEEKLSKLSQPLVSDWHLFTDKLPSDNEEILIWDYKEVRRTTWKLNTYLNDIKKGMKWKLWADACR